MWSTSTGLALCGFVWQRRFVLGIVATASLPLIAVSVWLLPSTDTPQTDVAAEQELSVASEQQADCPLDCVSERAVALVRKEGPEAAVAYAESVDDPIIRMSCHGLFHAIGRAAGKEGYPDYITDKCQYGYLHGVVQARALSFDETDAFLVDVIKYCANLDVERDQVECRHGIGHALALVIPGDIHAARRSCSMLPDELPLICTGGLLMEYAEDFQRDNGLLSMETNNGASSDIGTSYTNASSINYETLCPTVPSNIQLECYSRISMFIAPFNPTDVDKAAAVCSTAKEQIWYRACHIGFSAYYVATFIERLGNAWPPETEEQIDALGRAVVDNCTNYPEIGLCIESGVNGFSQLFSAGYGDRVPPVCEMVDRRWVTFCEDGMRQARTLAGLT